MHPYENNGRKCKTVTLLSLIVSIFQFSTYILLIYAYFSYKPLFNVSNIQIRSEATLLVFLESIISQANVYSSEHLFNAVPNIDHCYSVSCYGWFIQFHFLLGCPFGSSRVTVNGSVSVVVRCLVGFTD